MIHPPDPSRNTGDTSPPPVNGPTANPTIPDPVAPTNSSRSELVGTQIGNYRLECRLGEGGMGEVFRGVHRMLGGGHGRN